jgi:hypothetical protein
MITWRSTKRLARAVRRNCQGETSKSLKLILHLTEVFGEDAKVGSEPDWRVTPEGVRSLESVVGTRR